MAADNTYYVDDVTLLYFEWDPIQKRWVGVYVLPPMVVEAPPDEEEEDPGYFWDLIIRLVLVLPEEDWYSQDPPGEWEVGGEEDLVFQVRLELSGSPTIDCAPTGGTGTSDRKRDMRLWTDPPFPDLVIDNISKTRKSSPNYGHNHSVDNSDYECRGVTDVDDGFTDEWGEFHFYYRGPQAAGETVVTVEWTDPRGQGTPGENSDTFYSKHTGLVEITGGTGMSLTGHDSYHQAGDIHWATSTTKSKIEDLAEAFYNQYSENLMVNDASLRYGGLYDFGENWDPPHIEHREGKNVDVYPTFPDTPKWTFLKDEIVALGSTFVDKIDTSAPHLHFRE